jgi:Rad3-related DNA helicase
VSRSARGGNGATAGNGVEELRKSERLVAVGEGVLGVGMNFEDEARRALAFLDLPWDSQVLPL